MATRSTIGIQNEDGTIEVVYCHWDGYLEGVGETLKNYYDSEEKVRELLSYGNVSSLGEDVNSSHFYKRDRQEKDQEAEKVNTQEQYKKLYQEYNYLWVNDKWLYSEYDDNNFEPF